MIEFKYALVVTGSQGVSPNKPITILGTIRHHCRQHDFKIPCRLGAREVTDVLTGYRQMEHSYIYLVLLRELNNEMFFCWCVVYCSFSAAISSITPPNQPPSLVNKTIFRFGSRYSWACRTSLFCKGAWLVVTKDGWWVDRQPFSSIHCAVSKYQ